MGKRTVFAGNGQSAMPAAKRKASGKDKSRRKTAAMLAVLMGLSWAGGLEPWQIESFGAVSSEGGQENIVVIETAEDFLEFSALCTSETYSQGKAFALGADINLEGKAFSPVAVFAGTFDGGGHQITGLSVTSSGSNLGLFRYVQEGAVVKNLKVQGNISPSGSRVNIGGIAGTNRGRIENCVVSGLLTAHEALGGIVGCNEETGVVEGCVNQASLTGNLKTGGIAGWNKGQILESSNSGQINATKQGVDENASTQFSLGSIDLEESIRVERVNDGGGIAGLSSGVIKGCVNSGAVGYPHMGYNLGGIAGRQCGLIDRCQNFGQIQGRKDVGGIVGQLEPYLSVTYEEDVFDDLESQLDALSDMGDSLSRLIEETGDTASDDLEQVDDQMIRLKEIGRSYKDVYRDDGDQLEEDAGNSLDKIEFILNHLDVELVDGDTRRHVRSAKRTVQMIQELRASLKKGYEGDIRDIQAFRQWLDLRRQQLGQLIGHYENLQSDMLYVIAHAPGDVIDGVDDFGGELEELFQEISLLLDTLRFNRDQIREDFDRMDEEMTSELDVLSDDMHLLTDNLKGQKSKLREQKNQIQAQIDQIRDTVSSGVERAKEDKELFEDVSDLASGKDLGDGMVNGCINQGAISADFQAGGIVGIIGMETSLDPEQDLEAEDERTLNVTRNIKAIVFQCINQETVAVKNDYAGGIAGKANLGALIQNQNYGDITAEDGNYAGGITGSSAYVLRGNYNMCCIDGNDYTGGIAGWGTDILDNYAMVSFENREGEWAGSIAGDADPEGTIEGNVYVEEGIGALDGVTYAVQAQGMSYESFRALEHMPEAFGQLSVKFLVEGQVAKTIVCEYGSAVSREEFPKLPQKDGYYYQWEEKDLSRITGNEKVHAIYKPWNTTIASSEEKMPLMLAEANFYPGTVLEAEEDLDEAFKSQFALTEEWEEGYVMGKAYRYSITQPEGVPMPESITLHVLAKGSRKGSLVGCMEEGTVKVIDSRWDGDYLVFAVNGPGEFVVLEPKTKDALWFGLGGGILLLAAVWILAAKGKGRKGKKADGEEPEGRKKKGRKKPEGGEEGSDGQVVAESAGQKAAESSKMSDVQNLPEARNVPDGGKEEPHDGTTVVLEGSTWEAARENESLSENGNLGEAQDEERQ